MRACGRRGSGDGEFCHPSGLAITRSGEIIVADYQNDRIQFFNEDGQFLRCLGSHGTDETAKLIFISLSNLL